MWRRICDKGQFSEVREGSLFHELLFPVRSKLIFYMHHPTDRIAHTSAFVCYTSRGAQAGTRNSAMRDRSDDPSHDEFKLNTPLSIIAVPGC